ncbi:MAG: fibronectin type III domain-containing protein, partial [Gammaproteobacteria bacterium]|nr:fibronectin type III domain-containing protein [Gammaproteobacteria bacterium]
MFGLISAIVACSQKTTVDVSTQFNQSFPVPHSLLNAVIDSTSLTACVYVDGDSCHRMQIDEANNQAMLSLSVSPGEHNIFIEFSYNSDTFSKSFVLAGANRAVNIKTGANSLEFNEKEYYFPDNDSDTYINLIELENNTDPDDAGAKPAVSIPVISNISVATSKDSAIISWDTDVQANSTVLYGPDSNFGKYSFTTELVNSHTITLTSLVPGTTYKYVISSDREDNLPVYTNILTFTTPQ